MRGKVLEVTAYSLCKGITPAYAGKRTVRDIMRTIGWDHPRVCGEKAFSAITPESDLGSPPRMRGKDAGCIAPRPVQGITPAYAGKSFKSFS